MKLCYMLSPNYNFCPPCKITGAALFNDRTTRAVRIFIREWGLKRVAGPLQRRHTVWFWQSESLCVLWFDVQPTNSLSQEPVPGLIPSA